MAQEPLDRKNHMAVGPWVILLSLILHKQNTPEVSALVLQQTQTGRKVCCPYTKD